MQEQSADYSIAKLSTDDLPQKHRNAAIRDFFGRMMQRLDYSPVVERPMRIEAAAMALPGITYSRSQFSDIRVERSRELLADGRDDVVLSWVGEGCRYRSPHGRDFEVEAGGFMIWSLDRRFDLTLPKTWQASASLQLPRASLQGLVNNLADGLGQPLSPSATPALRLAFRYGQGLWQEDLTSPELRQALANHLIDLVALTMGAVGDASILAARRGLRASRLAAAKAAIRARLDRPTISPTEIAAHLGITPRYLHMLFEDEGVTFAAYVTNAKLRRAHRALTQAGASAKRIIDIAFDAGFADIRSFNRAFRRHFNMTPTEARDRTRR